MGFQQGLSGLAVASRSLEVIGNNIANSSVVGFKGSTVQFGDMYADSLTGGTGGVPVGIGSLMQSVAVQFTQGNITNTNNPLDVAIHGQGFFRLEKDGVITYSRNGQFHLANDGTIRNASDDKLTGLSANALGIFPVGATPSPIVVDSSEIMPKTTQKMQIDLNLNSAAKMLNPVAFDAKNPSTYTNSTSGTVYDSKGAQHIMTMYFVQNGASNELSMQAPVIKPSAVDIPAIEGNLITINGVSIGAPLSVTDDPAVRAADLVAAINAENIPGLTADIPDIHDADGNPIPGSSVRLTSTINPLNVGLTGAANLASTGLATGSPYTTYVTVDGVLGVASNKGVSQPANSIGFGDMAAGDIMINGKQVVAITGGSDASAQGNAIAKAINESNIAGVTATADAAGKVTVKSNLNPLHIVLNEASDVAKNSGLLGSSGTDARFDPDQSGGVTVAGNSAGHAQLNFDSYGKLITPTTGLQISVDLDKIGTLTNPKSPLTFSLDLTNATSFASPFGVTKLTQDGYSAGKLSNFAIDDDGIVMGHYSNGQAKALGQMVLANFASIYGLQSDGANQWKETLQSGQPLIGLPGTGPFGSLQASAVEDSNVDLTTQLVEMITAQRAYQANAQTIKTQDQILQTLVNLR